MSRTHERQRWYPHELVKIFTSLNDNFDLWYENSREACIKAIQVTGTSRNISSVHAKVGKMTRAMNHYIKTGEKTSDEIIWKNKNIHDMVKKICKRSEKREREENREHIRKRKRKRDEEEEQGVERKRKPFGDSDVEVIEIIDPETDTQMNVDPQETSIQMNVDSKETFIRMNVDPQLPFSIEAINELYKRKMHEAKQDYNQIHNLTGQIFKLESELKKKIEERNVKVEKLKDFRFLPNFE